MKNDTFTTSGDEWRESRDFYRKIFDLSPAAIILTELHTGKIIEFNIKLCEITGYNPEEIYGKTTTELHFIDFEKRENLVKILMQNNKVNDFQLQLSTKSGEIKHCMISSTILDLAGEQLLINTLSDITTLVKAQEDIKKLSIAIENSASSIIITGVDGTIEYVNPGFTNVSGYSPEEVIGKNPAVLKSNFHSYEFYKTLWETILSGQTWRGEFNNLAKNGNVYWERAVISPVINPDTGIITNFVAIKEDITESKKQMEELVQSEQKLMELNATKDKFFSIIAHDLMDPFNALMGFNEILLQALKEGEMSDSINYATIMKQSVARIFNLLQNMLLWTRTQRKKLNIQAIIVNVGEMVSEILEVLKPVTGNKKINLQLNVEKNLKARFDYNMISTVVRNLMNNAIKYTGEQGTIILNAKVVDGNMLIEISDNGQGIEEEHLEQIFRIDKTYRAKKSDDETGTGLGLIISKEFVELHGGHIYAKSIYGKGSTFGFSIPDRMNAEL